MKLRFIKEEANACLLLIDIIFFCYFRVSPQLLHSPAREKRKSLKASVSNIFHQKSKKMIEFRMS